MDTARDVRTLEIIEAEELWNMLTVEGNGYICRGCAQQVFPASYDKAINKKRPYFKLGPLQEHLENCDVDGEAKIVKRATKERVGTPEGFPVPYPNRLTLTDERAVEPVDMTSGAVDARARTEGSRECERDAKRKHHGHTVKTIRTICRTYIKFPNDRPHMALSIPDVSGGTYSKVFKSLWGKPEPFPDPIHLFYGPIRWTVEPIITDEYCELTISAGEWDETTTKYKGLYRARVNWAGWSKSRRDSLIREYEVTRREARIQSQANKAIQGLLFFVGTQDGKDPYVFHVEHYRLICSLTGLVERSSKK